MDMDTDMDMDKRTGTKVKNDEIPLLESAFLSGAGIASLPLRCFDAPADAALP